MRIDAELAKQFADLGAPIAIDERPLSTSQDFEVFAANWPAVATFLACETQWRVVSRMVELVWLGLDYVAADVVLRRTKAPDEVFDDLLVMETAALAALGEAS